MVNHVYIAAERDGWTDLIQLSIGDENGGYRLAGPKFNGSSTVLQKRTLTERDAKEIRRYLDKAFPSTQRTSYAGPADSFRGI